MSADIVSEFMCPCEDHCGKALEVCECGDAATYVKEIRDMQSKGFTAQAVRDKFVERYGPTVLASPPAHGFGLLVYILPPSAVFLGVLVVLALVRKWKQKKPAAPTFTPADLKKAEEQLKKWNS